MSVPIKNSDELLNILKAAAIGDVCFSHILDFIKVGMSEIKIAEEIEKTMSKLGSEGLAFPTICVSGPNSALPHGEPSERKIQEGDFITMDFGAVINGYCSDMTRTIGVGDLSEEQVKVYNIVLNSQLAGLKACKAGISCKFVDTVCRDIIKDASYGEYYIHGTGHGVGNLVHEAPTLNQKSDEVLKENMAVTIEPGIYIPNKFGVRIEDLAIITDFGIINTVKSEKKLIAI